MCVCKEVLHTVQFQPWWQFAGAVNWAPIMEIGDVMTPVGRTDVMDTWPSPEQKDEDPENRQHF